MVVPWIDSQGVRCCRQGRDIAQALGLRVDHHAKQAQCADGEKGRHAGRRHWELDQSVEMRVQIQPDLVQGLVEVRKLCRARALKRMHVYASILRICAFEFLSLCCSEGTKDGLINIRAYGVKVTSRAMCLDDPGSPGREGKRSSGLAS